MTNGLTSHQTACKFILGTLKNLSNWKFTTNTNTQTYIIQGIILFCYFLNHEKERHFQMDSISTSRFQMSTRRPIILSHVSGGFPQYFQGILRKGLELDGTFSNTLLRLFYNWTICCIMHLY